MPILASRQMVMEVTQACAVALKVMMSVALRRAIKRMHYPLEVMLTCVRWYAANPLRR